MTVFLLHPSVFPHDRDFRCFLLPRFFERLFWNIQFEPWPLPFIKNEVHHEFHLFDTDIILSMWNWTIDVDVTGLHIFCTRGYFHTPLFSHFDTSRWFHHVLNSPWHNCVKREIREKMVSSSLRFTHRQRVRKERTYYVANISLCTAMLFWITCLSSSIWNE